MSRIKEPTFFAAPDLLSDPYRARFLKWLERDPLVLRAFLRDGEKRPARHWVLRWDEYVELFRGVRDEIAVGEATVNYFWLPSAAGEVRAQVPDARLVFLLRHPAERLFSWYLLALWSDHRLPFRDWFERARQPDAVWWPAVDAGRYATHLSRFFGLFPRTQIHVQLYEDFRRDPGAALRDIFAFLAVDPDRRIDVTRRHNETVVPRFPAFDRLRRRLFGDRGARVLWRFERLYYRRRSDFTFDPRDRQMVTEYYREEVERTGELIGRDLTAWQ